MSVKILTSTIIGIDAFCQDPAQALQATEQGAVAVFANNAPQFYALTPQRLAQLLAAEAAMQARNDVALDEDLFQDDAASPVAIAVPAGKFSLYDGWQPDADFVRLAAVWGVPLSAPVTPAELASFVAYWQAEGRMFHHVQWQQKLARSLQVGRATNGGQPRRDLTQVAEPDHTIPDGFRG